MTHIDSTDDICSISVIRVPVSWLLLSQLTRRRKKQIGERMFGSRIPFANAVERTNLVNGTILQVQLEWFHWADCHEAIYKRKKHEIVGFFFVHVVSFVNRHLTNKSIDLSFQFQLGWCLECEVWSDICMDRGNNKQMMRGKKNCTEDRALRTDVASVPSMTIRSGLLRSS
jgi:hypothetical protein